MGERSPWLAVLFGIFTALGALMLLVGDGADRLWGLVCLAFFGAGGVAVFAPKGAGGPGVAIERVDRPNPEWALSFALDTRRRTVVTIASLVIGGAGVVMAWFAGDLAAGSSSPVVLRVVGTVCAAFFGGGGAFGLMRRKTEARMLLTEAGVEFESGGSRTFVPWDAIEWAGAVKVHGNDMLGLRASDPARIETGGVAKRFLRFNRGVTGVDAAQPFGLFVAPPEVVLAAVSRFVRRPEDRKLLSTGGLDISELVQRG